MEKYLEFEAEVTVDDDANTVTIKTSKPYANLVGQLCHPTMGITDVEHIENYDNGIIGTGLYKIDEFNKSDLLYMLKCKGLSPCIIYDKLVVFNGEKIVFAKKLSDLFFNDLVDLIEPTEYSCWST